MTLPITSESTVGNLAATLPGAARAFEELGIDYCCSGRRPLAQACAAKGLDLAAVLKRLEQPAPAAEQDWSAATMTALCDHIESAHHAKLKAELPRVAGLIDKVLRAHGDRHPEFAEVHVVFRELSTEMLQHMEKEELVLFPALRRLESQAAPAPIHRPIACMEDEHEHAGVLMQRLRTLTNGFTPPSDACTTFRVLLNDLAAMERDLHSHVHKENNILFPKALCAAGAPA
jgi:regulator of cell morphogenesis and NO signaling